MTLFDKVILRTQVWLDDLERERDAAALAMAVSGVSRELELWMQQLDRERADVMGLMVDLERLSAKNMPALLFPQRPMRQAKASLPAKARKRA